MTKQHILAFITTKKHAVIFICGITVQYEGLANEIFGSELEKAVAAYHIKVPGAAIYRSHPTQTYFKVTPTWIRYSDLSGEEEQVVEFRF